MASVNTSVRVGITSNADYLMASQGASFKKAAGTAQGLADAKMSTKGNQKDDLVIQLSGRRDILILSASKLDVPTGKMPAAGDTIQLLKDGKAINGKVQYVDIESAEKAPVVSEAPVPPQPTPAEAALVAAAEKQAEAARSQAAAAQAELQDRRRKEKAQATAAGLGLLLLGGAAVGGHVKRSLR